jgi:hypothetical protein
MYVSTHARKISALSFYPGCGDNSHELASLTHRSSGFHPPQVDDEGTETEEDPANDKPSLLLALKYPNKFSESLATEVSSLSSTSTD